MPSFCVFAYIVQSYTYFPGLHCHSSLFDVHLKNKFKLFIYEIKCRHVFVAFKNIC